MAIYVYRRDLSVGAKELVAALGQAAVRWRDRIRPLTTKVRAGDVVVCWGEAFTSPIPGVKVLNGAPLQNKYQDAVKLAEKGVATIEVSLTIPQTAPVIVPAGPDPALQSWDRVIEVAEDFANIELDTQVPRTAVTLAAVSSFEQALAHLRAQLNVPAPVERTIPGAAAGDWLGRDRNHVGGADLLNPTPTPDYYAKKIDGIVNEYRVHSFKNKSIRAGIKDVRIDPEWVSSGRRPHDWVRSWDGGYRIKYDGVSSKQRHRDIAHAAIEALDLDFGAVDIGEKADGSLVVFEVNRAPGIEGGSVENYKNAINEWLAAA